MSGALHAGVNNVPLIWSYLFSSVSVLVSYTEVEGQI